MNRFRYKKYIIVVFAIFAVMTYVINVLYPQEIPVVQITEENHSEYIQMYLLNNEYIVPISFVPVSEEKEEQIKEIIEYMNGMKHLEDFEPLFSSDTKIKDIKIKNHKVYLNFKEINYKIKHELKILESLAWSMTQFDDIHEVKILLDDKELKVMPLGNTPVPEVLNRTIGLNNFESADQTLHDSSSVICYYTRTINDQIYYVPISIRTNPMKEKWSAFEKVSVSTHLISPLADKNIKIQSLQQEKNIVKVNVSSNILKKDKTADKSSFETLLLSLQLLYPENDVKIYVNGVLINDKNENKIIINKIKL